MADRENGGGVYIPNHKIYDEVIGLREDVRPLKDIPARVRKLEFRYYALLVALSGSVAVLISKGAFPGG